MKARSRSPLRCGCVPAIGEPIVVLDDQGWICATHALALLHDRMAAEERLRQYRAALGTA
jgi:hypothetical protein